jgi:hypothetical protein
MTQDLDISYQTLAIECPNCHFQLDILVKQVIAEETIICNGCLQEIKLVDEGSSFLKANQKVNDAVEEIMKSFRKIGRRK